MNQQHVLPAHEILVAASIARQHGFTQTQSALQEMAKCSLCRNASRCSGAICVFGLEDRFATTQH